MKSIKTRVLLDNEYIVITKTMGIVSGLGMIDSGCDVDRDKLTELASTMKSFNYDSCSERNGEIIYVNDITESNLSVPSSISKNIIIPLHIKVMSR